MVRHVFATAVPRLHLGETARKTVFARE